MPTPPGGIAPGEEGEQAVEDLGEPTGRPNIMAYLIHATNKNAEAKTFGEALRINVTLMILVWSVPLIVIALAVVGAVIYFYLGSDLDRWAQVARFAGICLGSTGVGFGGVTAVRRLKRRGR